MSATPNPGSREAIALGCTCPVIDNHYGRGWRGRPDAFVVIDRCPVHDPEPPQKGPDHDQ